MDFLNLVTELVQSSKYILLFFLYLFGGPIPNFVTSVMASNGVLNIFTVFVLVMSAEFTGDTLYYGLGRYIPKGWLDRKIMKYEGKGILKEFDRAFRNHPFLTLTIVKVASVIAVPGLFIMGRKKYISWNRYLPMSVFISLIKNIVICFLGYTTGIQLDRFKEMYSTFTYISILVLLTVLIVFTIKVYRKRIEKVITNQMEKLGRDS